MTNRVRASIANTTYKTELTNFRHHLLADEPPEEQGSDLGPTPDELLMMSLASCTAITLQMYANRKQYLLSEIRVDVEMTRTESGTRFMRDIFISPSLPDEQMKRMLHVANACPVHKTLTQSISVDTEFT